MSIIHATKKNRVWKAIFDYPDLTKDEALKRAKEEIRNLIKPKRMYGWKFKIQ